MSIYAFEPGPRYRGATETDLWQSAAEQPLSMLSTIGSGVVSGALESFGLGTAIRGLAIPEGEASTGSRISSALRLVNPLTTAYETTRLAFQAGREDSPAMAEDEWKSSAFYRENIPYDPGMTRARAEALASWDDARKVRDHFAAKRPISAFIGNLTGQALDPINYVPVAGPAVKAAAIARAGRVAGTAAVGAVDAAANTAIFGLATRGQRSAYGDDVSWQTTISEIATAALIGSAFGGIAGALEGRAAARANARAQTQLSTLKATQEARIALNEAIDAVVRGEDVRLSPNATEPIARAARVEATRLPTEVDRSWAGGNVEGQSVVTPTGLRVGVRAEVVDASELVGASGDLQPRDRTRAASDAQIAEMAANLDPARLMPGPEADRGAPVVGPDGVVESGNGRVAAIRRAAETNPERFEAYKQALRDAGYDVPEGGIPVLVQRRTSDLTPAQRVQFVNDANTSAIARMSATEIAMTDVRAMTPNVLGNYVPGDVNSAANRPFVSSFMKNLPANERASLVDASGRLNAEGVRRTENALIAAAYGDSDVIARFAETPDDNVKSIMGAMSDAAGEWAAMRRGFETGEIDPELDVTANLTDALRFMSRAREKAVAERRPVATVIREDLGQIDLLAGDIDPSTKAFIHSFYKNDQFSQANGRDIIAAHLTNITKAAQELGRPQLFGDATAVRPSEMIANARPQDRQADIFASGRDGAGDSGNSQVGQDGQVRQVGETGRDGSSAGDGAGQQPGPVGGPLDKKPLSELIAEVKSRNIRRKEMVKSIEASGQTSVRMSRDDSNILVGPNTVDGEQPFRITYFGSDGTPSGHTEFKTYADALDEALTYGYTPRSSPDMSARVGQGSRALDLSPPRPDPPPEGRKEAEARIARPDDQKAMADQYRVNPETGDFPELDDIEQLRLAGRLTEADIADLDAAKADMDTAEAYGEALKSVTGCLL